MGPLLLVVFGVGMASGPYLVHRGTIPKVWAGSDTPATGPLFWLWSCGLVLVGVACIAFGIAGLTS